MRKYSVIRNYKKFKSEYKNFVLFIKCGDYYYTYDSDAKIMMYFYDTYRETASFRIEKIKFKSVLNYLLKNGINVVLAGWKNTREYYSENLNEYEKIKRKAKLKYKSVYSKMSLDEVYYD